jgi:AbiU2
MEDFSHLEPLEKLFIARNRLGMLSNVLVEVLKLNEQKKAFVTSRLYKSAQGHEANELLLETMVHYEIAQVCRLWDDFDQTGFGLPTMASLLRGADVRNLLSTADTDVIVNLRPNNEEFLAAAFDPAVKETTVVLESQQIKRIKNYRNKVIAHPIYRTRQELKNNIEIVRPDDIEYAVENALRIVDVFETALSLTPSNYWQVRIEFSRIVGAFYKTL